MTGAANNRPARVSFATSYSEDQFPVGIGSNDPGASRLITRNPHHPTRSHDPIYYPPCCAPRSVFCEWNRFFFG